jgi:hypothetical protein
MRTIARLRHELDVTRNSQPATSAPVGATPVAVEDVAELRVVRAENTELREQLRRSAVCSWFNAQPLEATAEGPARWCNVLALCFAVRSRVWASTRR